MIAYAVFACIIISEILAQGTCIRDPEISYSFITKADGGNCSRDVWISDSRFTFAQNNLSGFLNISDTRIIPAEVEQLYLRCTHTHPIRWLARKPLSSINYLVGPHPCNTKKWTHTGGQYFEKLIVVNLKARHFSRMLRCETYEKLNYGRTSAAELFLNVPQDFAPIINSTKETRPRTKRWFHAMPDKVYAWDTQANKPNVIIPCVAGNLTGLIDYMQTRKLQNKSDDSFDYFKLIKRNRFGTLTSNKKIIFVPDERNYDPRIGFKVEDPTVHQSVFECQHRFPPYVEEMIPVIGEPENYLESAQFVIRNDEEQPAMFRISCDAGRFSDSVHIRFGSCQSLLECELMWAPLYPVLFSEFPKDVTIARPQIHGNNLTNGFFPGSYHGFVHCTGVFANSTLPQKFHVVSTFSYMLTDLNGTTDFLNLDNVDQHVVMKLNLLNSDFKGKNLSAKFQCNISTFLLVDETLEFRVQFRNGDLYVCRNEGTYRENITRGPDDDIRAVAVWNLEFPIGQVFQNVSCRAQYMHKNLFKELKIAASSIFNITDEDGRVGDNTLIFIIAMITIAPFVILILSCSLCVLWRKYVAAVNTVRTLTTKEQREFFVGDGRQDLGEFSTIYVDGLAFDPEKRIKRDNIKANCSPDEILGEGNFGIVHRGEYDNKPVAIKSPKPNADKDFFMAFLKEIKIMSYLGDHDHIVRFLGAIVDKIKSGECMAVIEFSPYGNLNGFLRTNAGTYLDLEIIAEPNVRISSRSETNVQLNQQMLQSYCEQIAIGMEFLAEKRVIHGDLATRNVLVFENGVVKITDFGLSKQLYNCSEYSKTSTSPLPWRWMALETLRHHTFSTKSDVWSYGVTLWEIFTFGKIPYPGVNWTSDYVDNLANGQRLLKPAHAADILYDWMMRCWLNDPDSRPTFTECKIFFVGMRFIPKKTTEHYETAC